MPEINQSELDKIKFGGLIITLGIVYGDLGTSPLYTMQAIMLATKVIDKTFILGALSCVFWTIMLEATFKYVVITLRASNKGEGGIFSLFAMVRNKSKWAFVIAIIGACALMADGVITPAITVTSAMEGVKIFAPWIPVVGVVLIILTLIFLIQPFGTKRIGKLFGPAMLCWFTMLLVLGIMPVIRHPEVLKALNPYYAIHAIVHNPDVLKFMGAVFLCTTGAEALYSDLGHVGIKNIRATWVFVSISLIVNYFGQGAWLLEQGHKATSAINPFYAIMPSWFLVFGVIISTAAAIIASQALITGTFTIVAEAISLNFFPQIRIRYPANLKRQMYVPKINWLLYICCVFVVLYFRNATAMESAYGLSISFAMLCTSVLLVMYMHKRVSIWLIMCYVVIYSFIEVGFLTANMTKFFSGGWVTILLSGLFISVMYCWAKGESVSSKFVIYKDLRKYLPVLRDLKNDETVPQYASNLVYITDAEQPDRIETTIIYSILRKPKRADRYWFIHIDTVDVPHALNYQVQEVDPGLVYWINMKIGFKEEMKVNLYFKQIVEDLCKNNKYSIISPHPSLKEHEILTDFHFIVLSYTQNKDYSFRFVRQLVMNYFFSLKRVLVNDIQYLGMEHTLSSVESVPIVTSDELSLDKAEAMAIEVAKDSMGIEDESQDRITPWDII